MQIIKISNQIGYNNKNSNGGKNVNAQPAFGISIKANDELIKLANEGGYINTLNSVLAGISKRFEKWSTTLIIGPRSINTSGDRIIKSYYSGKLSELSEDVALVLEPNLENRLIKMFKNNTQTSFEIIGDAKLLNDINVYKTLNDDSIEPFLRHVDVANSQFKYRLRNTNAKGKILIEPTADKGVFVRGMKDDKQMFEYFYHRRPYTPDDKIEVSIANDLFTDYLSTCFRKNL